MIPRLLVLTQHQCVTDGLVDRQTETSLIHKSRISVADSRQESSW